MPTETMTNAQRRAAWFARFEAQLLERGKHAVGNRRGSRGRGALAGVGRGGRGGRETALADVELAKGRNDLLFRVTQGGGDFGLQIGRASCRERV